MQLSFRKIATAEQVAEMHRHLADAVQALQRAGAVRGERIGSAALTCASQDRLLKVARGIQYAAIAMESDFMARAGDGAPFATMADPGAWERWLSGAGSQA